MGNKRNDDSLEQIAELLINADSVLIFPHIQMDGDALGSSTALCLALRNCGKKAGILIEDKIPDNLKFLDNGICIADFDGGSYDVCIAVDCSDVTRIGIRKDIFYKGKNTAMIDHHTTAQPFADICYIDEVSSSTGEIVYRLLGEMKYPIDSGIAESIYTAIVTDTGRFMYANTSGTTHEIVADLYKTQMDHDKVAIEIYQKRRVEKVRLFNAILGTMDLLFDGRCNLAYMTRRMLEDAGAYSEETEGLVEELRSVNGVEIAVFLKEEEEGIKVTMRSKSWADVSKIAEKFGGGGHRKASGCTIPGDIEQVKALIIDAVKSELNASKG